MLSVVPILSFGTIKRRPLDQ